MPTDQLSLTFAALADPTRRSILTRLADGEATVRELAEPFVISLPAISRHLKVLESAGLIIRGRDAQWRPSRMQPEPLDDAIEWMQSRKQAWEDRMDRLDTHLRQRRTPMSDPTSVASHDEQVLITRIFDAPREDVFRAWTDPDELAAWYGPPHVEVPPEKVHIDLRVGGRWELTMVQSDGREMTIGYEILELDAPELLVMRSDPMPRAGMPDGALLRLELFDHGAKTRMSLADGPYPTVGRGHAETGWHAALDKLAACLGSSSR